MSIKIANKSSFHKIGTSSSKINLVKKSEEPESNQIENNESNQGQIRCGRIIHYRAQTSESKKHPTLPGFININVSSGGNSKWKTLSPMKLGPFTLIEDKIIIEGYPDGIHPGFEENTTGTQRTEVKVFENFWQYSKIYNLDLSQEREIGVRIEDSALDSNNSTKVKNTFFHRRAQGFADPKGHRRALPKAKGYPISSYFSGKFYPYLESRIFYCRVYRYLVERTEAWQELLELHNQGVNLFILGYDGRDIDITYNSLVEAYLDDSVPFGHELVLCAMLKQYYVWDVLDETRTITKLG